jgi:hypothetical protein
MKFDIAIVNVEKSITVANVLWAFALDQEDVPGVIRDILLQKIADPEAFAGNIIISEAGQLFARQEPTVEDKDEVPQEALDGTGDCADLRRPRIFGDSSYTSPNIEAAYGPA